MTNGPAMVGMPHKWTGRTKLYLLPKIDPPDSGLIDDRHQQVLPVIAEVPGHDDASAVASCRTPDPSPAGCIVTGPASGGFP